MNVEYGEVKFATIREALNATQPGAVIESRTRMLVVGRSPEYAHLPLPPGNNGSAWQHEVSSAESSGYYVRAQDLLSPPGPSQ